MAEQDDGLYEIAARAQQVEPATGRQLVDAETDDVLPGEPGSPADVPDTDRPTLYATVTWKRDEPRPPVVPAWLRNPQQRREVMRWAVRAAGYHLAWQGRQTLTRYSWAVPWYATRGTARIAWRAGVWVAGVDNGLHQLRQEAATRNDTDSWHKLEQHRLRLVAWRGWALAMAVLAIVLGVLALIFWAPWWAPWLLGIVAVPTLARVGRPVDKPILVRTTAGARFTRLTAEMVRNAAARLGVPGLTDPGQVDFPPPGVHRDGPGWLARINLPAGVKAVKVLERREEWSSALRLPVDQIWPEAGPDHAGQVDLWVGWLPASKMRLPRWKLADPHARTSFFEAFPFSTDARGRPVSTLLFERSYLIGGQPGSGKTYTARSLALGAALDPIVELMIAEFKGVGDFLDLAPLCSTYIVGVDYDAFEATDVLIDDVLRDCERRGKLLLKAKERGQAPHGKVTPELAARPGSGLHPKVVVIDEFHEWIIYDKEENKGAGAKKLERAIRRGRALGITFVLATQIPDSKSVPPNITRCVTNRLCHSVAGQVENDMILGTGAYKRGVSGTTFRPGDDAGWSVVMGLSAPVTARSYFPDEADRKAIVERATQLRGGQVVGDGVRAPVDRDVLDDVLHVFAHAGRRSLHWKTLAAQLVDQFPDAYRGANAEAVSALVRAAGVESKDVKVEGTTLKGCYRAEVEAAIKRREVTDGR